jgi:uncharacterized protein (DUF305 family)
MESKISVAAAAFVLAGTIALAGCSGPASSDHSSMPGMEHGSSAAPASGANDADAMFARMMIVHHQQAVEMSDLVLAKEGVDGRVRDLAERIKAAQAPEIDRMQGWLDEWGADAPDDSMDHGDGMMTDEDMAALEAASGAEASRLFLEQMIVHHEGAIAMAKTQIADGEDADAVALAESIAAAQSDEIAEMRKILDSL